MGGLVTPAAGSFTVKAELSFRPLGLNQLALNNSALERSLALFRQPRPSAHQPLARTRSGAGTLPGCSGRQSGRTSIHDVILDVFSRYVEGWMVGDGESAELAKRLIADTCGKQANQPGQLKMPCRPGSSRTSKPVALIMADLGVNKAHGPPYVSDDNPYLESQFRALKYPLGFPERFGSFQGARAFSQEFLTLYNEGHRHSGIGLLPPRCFTRVWPPPPSSGAAKPSMPPIWHAQNASVTVHPSHRNPQ